MTLRINDEKVKFNIDHDKKSLNNIITCHRLDVINNGAMNMQKNGLEESWKDVYEDTKIFKKKKKLHDRLAHRRHFASIHHVLLLNSRL